MILYILFSILFVYLVTSVLYGFIFSLAGALGKLPRSGEVSIRRKFAVFLPSYKEDAVILNSAEDALKQNYPSDSFDVVVIADSLQGATIAKLRAMSVKVIEVAFEKSTKSRSLNAALKQLPENYDYALVLDADNLMERDFIKKMNAAFVERDVKAIQGHRVAKNLNTKFAVLDAISEEVNNHIYRKGQRVLGLSSGLIGSGMAFEYKYFKNIMATVDAIGGFDKELEVKLNRDKVKIHYLEDAIVYDEKVENPHVFQNQRRRWIAAQLVYLQQYFTQGLVHLFSKGNVDYFNKVFQFILLPRVLLLGTVTMMFALAAICETFNIILAPNNFYWAGLFVMNVVSILLAVPGKFYNRETLRAAMELPKAIGLMFLTLFKLKGANNKFIHTPHSGSMNVKTNS